MSDKPNRKFHYRPVFARKKVLLGAGLGLILGAVLGKPAIGMVIGACVGIVIDRSAGKNPSE